MESKFLAQLRSWGVFEIGWRRPVVVGALLRLVATLSGVGYLFADDYSSVIEPAYAWLDDPSAPFPWGIRSELFPRFFSWCLLSARALGFDDPATMMQWAYGILGLCSLVAIVGTYYLSERFFGPRSATVAAWLTAAYPLMPRISTRALIEVACLPPLVWGLCWLARPSARPNDALRFGVLGGALIGIAAMFRFQVGLIYIGAFGVVLVQALHGEELRISRYRLCGMLLGGGIAAALQALVDTLSYGWPLASLYTYIKFNLESATELYGRTGDITTYVLFFVLLALPPAAIAFAKPFWVASCRAPLISIPLAFFVLVHSFIPHKEERFMFSGLPMFFALLAPSLVTAVQSGVWSRRAVAFFSSVCFFALPWITLSDSQQSATAPLLEIARSAKPPDRIYWVAHREPPSYYAGGQSEVVWAVQRESDSNRDHPLLADVLNPISADPGGPERARFVFARPPNAISAQEMARAGFSCGSPKSYPADLLDDLVYRINPKRNLRRSPTTVLDCSRRAPAS